MKHLLDSLHLAGRELGKALSHTTDPDTTLEIIRALGAISNAITAARYEAEVWGDKND
jgi:hypothetical protein